MTRNISQISGSSVDDKHRSKPHTPTPGLVEESRPLLDDHFRDPPSHLLRPSQELRENGGNHDDTMDPHLKKLADYLIQSLREIKVESSNSWGEVATALNRVDDNKIGHCKEDIDTLLVFAGLFSAVLTAFVIESYQSLSPDPSVQIIQLLTQIAAQTTSSSLPNGVASAMSAAQSFEPSTLAVYVNRLWFSSLVLSLITASFGILIKQWLREYKSVDTHFSNLRSRLRIRQFRYPGLVKWRVFELAAILPLLIQVALGLFLLGLCLFTWSINASVGRATTVVVSAWIFFFVATTFAPIFSSSCPYKITFFTPILGALRTQINRSICLKWLDFGPRIEKPQLPEVEFIILNWALVLLSYIPRIFSRLLALLTKGRIKEWQPPLTIKAVEIDKALRTTSLEENDIAADDQKDLELLSTVDSILSDDELLHTTMCAMVVRGQFKPLDIIAFVREVLVHRLPQVEEFLVPGSSLVVDLRKLPPRVWGVVVDLTCAALQVHPHQRKEGRGFLDVVPSSVYHDALAVFLSRVNDPLVAELGPSVLRTFAFSFTEMPQIAPGAFAHLSIREILVHLRRFFPAGEFKKPTLVSRLHRAVHCHPRCQHISLAHQFLAHRDVFDGPNQLLDMVYQCLQESIDWEATPSEGLSELLCAIVIPDLFDNGDTRGAFAKRIFTALSRAPPAFLGQLITTSFAENLLRFVTEVRMPFLLEILGSRKFLHILILALARYLDVAPVSDLVIRQMSKIISVLCMRTLRMFEAAIRPLAEDPDRLQNEEEWVALLHLLSEGVNSRYYEPVHEEYLHSYATNIGTKYSDLFAALLPEPLLTSITHIASATYPLDDSPQTNSPRVATGLQDDHRLDSMVSLSVLRSSKTATRATDAVDSIIRQFGVELRALEADWLWAKAQAWRGR